MNFKWIITFNVTPMEDEATFESYVFIDDSEAMTFIMDHNIDFDVIMVAKNPDYKGDLDE